MIKGRQRRNRTIERANEIFVQVVSDSLTTQDDPLFDLSELAKRSIEASIVFEEAVIQQLGPEEESTYEGE